MAKLKTDDTPADTTAPAADTPQAPPTPDTPDTPVTAPVQEPEAASQSPSAKSSAKPKAAPAGADPSPEVQHLLRLHPQYETLYIDRHGGAYAPGTPQCVRGEAPLYRNSFYKPDKS